MCRWHAVDVCVCGGGGSSDPLDPPLGTGLIWENISNTIIFTHNTSIPYLLQPDNCQ